MGVTAPPRPEAVVPPPPSLPKPVVAPILSSTPTLIYMRSSSANMTYAGRDHRPPTDESDEDMMYKIRRNTDLSTQLKQCIQLSHQLNALQLCHPESVSGLRLQPESVSGLRLQQPHIAVSPSKETSERDVRSVDVLPQERFPQGRSKIVQGWDQRSPTGVQRRETGGLNICAGGLWNDW